MTAGGGDRFGILIVCTGNVFRSRIAEHHLRLELGNRLGDRAETFEVASAGSRVRPGRPVQASEAAALARVGLPDDQRPSRLLAPGDVVRADLVLCADRSHRAVVLDLAPGALRRTFLLREFARVAGPALAMAGQADGASAADAPVVVARRTVAAAARYRGQVPGGAGVSVGDDEISDDEIRDPWDESAEVLAHAAALIRAAVPAIADALVVAAGPSPH